MIKWTTFAEWVFFALLSYVALGMSGKIEKSEIEIQELKLFRRGVEVSQENNGKTLGDHETRIRTIENNKK